MLRSEEREAGYASRALHWQLLYVLFCGSQSSCALTALLAQLVTNRIAKAFYLLKVEGRMMPTMDARSEAG